MGYMASARNCEPGVLNMSAHYSTVGSWIVRRGTVWHGAASNLSHREEIDARFEIFRRTHSPWNDRTSMKSEASPFWDHEVRLLACARACVSHIYLPVFTTAEARCCCMAMP